MIRKFISTLYREGFAEAYRKSVERVLWVWGHWCLDVIKKYEKDPDSALSAEQVEVLARNSKFRNRHQGKRCFVIGNGPSLGTQDLSHLGKEITFTVGAFYKHPAIKQWQPNYYFFADPVFFTQEAPARAFFDEMLKHVHTSEFFAPLVSRPFMQKLNQLPQERLNYANMAGVISAFNFRQPLDLTRTIPGVTSVAQMAIMAAIHMGCSPIYLMGLDHDWLAHRGMDKHFYQGLTVPGNTVVSGMLDYPYYQEIQAMGVLWEGYYRLDNIAKERGIKIFNATNGGFLDVFERVQYPSLFEKSSS